MPMIPRVFLFVLACVSGCEISAGADAAKVVEAGNSSGVAGPSGIVLDDDAGEFTGDWVSSSKQAAFVGKSYRHDNNRDQGKKSARFTPDFPATGEYEVRLIYIPTNNRATKVPVTIVSADGGKTVTINEREDVLVNGVPRALGVFKFAAGRNGSVTISNSDADGFVVVDAMQFVPVEIAREEREGRRSAGFGQTTAKADAQRAGKTDAPETATAHPDWIAATALSPLAKGQAKSDTNATRIPKPDTEPVQFAKDANPADVDGKSYDLIVVGGTAGGVACAVRAARDGCTVLLVQHNRHIGGMMSNGLMQWDALYGGHRAPLFTELLQNIEQHYIAPSARIRPTTSGCASRTSIIRWAGRSRTWPSASSTASSRVKRISRCCSAITRRRWNAKARS